MFSKLWAILVVIAVGSVVAIVGVAHYMGDGASAGQLAVAVHDAPCAECSHVWVTFQNVSVHESGANTSGWQTLNVSGSTVDLMALNGTALAKVIGVASMPAGHYEQVRLAVSAVTVQLTNGTILNASIPAASSGNVVGSFDISAGHTTTISIDVDLQSSLHVLSVGPTLVATFTPHLGSIEVTG